MSGLDWAGSTFVAMTPQKVIAGDGSLPITVGEAEDTARPVTLFRNSLSANTYLPSALYSLLLFDRSLSDDEIAWVRANLMDGGE